MAEYLYRGKTMDELKKLSLNELGTVANADVRRIITKKGFTVQEQILLKKISKKSGKKPIKTHCREMVILPSFVGLTINVHNGKEFVPVDIKPSMVFHRLGEYSLTTRFKQHGQAGLRATKSSGFVPIK